MKELSIEEKAKRYDEAIEIARQYYNDRAMPIGTNFKLERMFPELKESKDEKIRKSLLRQYKGFKQTDFYDDGITFGDVVSWFEKQGEQKLEWSDEDKRALNDAIVALSMYANGNIPNILPSQLLEDIEQLKSLNPQSQWKPSEEQLNVLDSAIYAYRNSANVTILKTLREQLKAL